MGIQTPLAKGQWFPSQRASNVEIGGFLCFYPKHAVELLLIWNTMTLMCVANVMNTMGRRTTVFYLYSTIHDDVIKWKHFPRN